MFRITKNNHNILQGVADPSLRLTAENKALFDEWIKKNGARWLAPGGPLAAGGVDVAFIDDPQVRFFLCGLIEGGLLTRTLRCLVSSLSSKPQDPTFLLYTDPISKSVRIFVLSRDRLKRKYGNTSGTTSSWQICLLRILSPNSFLGMSQQKSWLYLVQLRIGMSFVCDAVPYLRYPSRLDGLNKPLDSWDSQYYMGEFRTLCVRE